MSACNLIGALEDFFCNARFTCAIGEFLKQHGCELQFVGPDAEQPFSNHELFIKYCQIVEDQLCNFLETKQVKQEDVIAACQEAMAGNDAASLVCVDYLLASTEYEAFMQLAHDHVQLSRYQPEAGALDDFEIPADEDDDEDNSVENYIDE